MFLNVHTSSVRSIDLELDLEQVWTLNFYLFLNFSSVPLHHFERISNLLRTYHAEVQFYVNPVNYQKIDSHVRSAFPILPFYLASKVVVVTVPKALLLHTE